MNKKIGVILAGCGVKDGAEIYETTITLLALDRAGAKSICAAPNVAQAHVINHLNGEVAGSETRNVLVESARLARGEITDLAKLQASDLDGIIFPGGFGAAKNLCTYAMDGPNMQVQADVERITLDMVKAGKPVGTICIAPVMTAKILATAGYPVTLTIGNDPTTAGHIEGFGAHHKECAVDEVVIDEKLRVVSTPAYMLAQSIKEAAAGVEKLVQAVLSLCR